MDTLTLYNLFLENPLVTTDTRRCPENAIFFALRGANFNGNEFAQNALDAGCSYAVVDDEKLKGRERMIYVPSALKALQDLAAHHRRQLGVKVIQITGTNGKTTTKELVATVLAEQYNVLYTEGNLNNHIGVPLTLLRLNKEHEVAVIETGANHPGEIAELSRLVDADFGLITNVGCAHLEGFGSFEGVIRAKTELYDYLRTKQGAELFLHADNPHLSEHAHHLNTYLYSTHQPTADVSGEVVACDPFLAFRWTKKNGGTFDVSTHLIGKYNLDNVLAAVAVGCRFNISPVKISHAISHYTPKNNRSELLRTKNNTLIVDAYNANPTSMRAAIENFSQLQADNKMVILGEMRELGDASVEEHRALVDLIGRYQLGEIWLVGECFRLLSPNHRWFAHVDAVKQSLRQQPLKGKTILIKGSNGTRLFELPTLL